MVKGLFFSSAEADEIPFLKFVQENTKCFHNKATLIVFHNFWSCNTLKFTGDTLVFNEIFTYFANASHKKNP